MVFFIINTNNVVLEHFYYKMLCAFVKRWLLVVKNSNIDNMWFR